MTAPTANASVRRTAGCAVGGGAVTRYLDLAQSHDPIVSQPGLGLVSLQV
jgi:hypothetical protein